MTKTFFKLLPLFVLILMPVSMVRADNLSNKLSGRILLQVQGVGQAWYIDPGTKQRAFLGRPADAFQIMRELGLGISEKNYNSFNGYAPQNLSGRILLRVEANGEAYYVNPTDLKMYYLGRPADAFKVMREKGLGITNDDLNTVPVFQKYKEQTEANTAAINSLNQKIEEKQNQINELKQIVNTNTSTSTVGCTEDQWVCSSWGSCSAEGTQKRLCSILNNCQNVNTPSPSLSQSCNYPPNNTCSSWVYSSWNTCNNGLQTRSVISSYPSNCVGGTPNLSQSCSVSQTICTSWTYSDWSSCSSSGSQTRNIISSFPAGCSGGNPMLTQSCNSADTSISYSDYVLKYYFKQNNPVLNSLALVILETNTDRDIRIKKVVAKATNMTPSQILSIYHPVHNNWYVSMSQDSSDTWSYSSEMSLASSIDSIYIMASGSGGLNANVQAAMDQWEVWDYTSNKPVKLELTTAPVQPTCASVNYDSTYINSIITAIQNDQLDTIKSMLANYPCGHLQELLDLTLVQSAWKGKLDIAQYILQQSTADVDAKTQSFSALYEAAGNGNLDIAQLLLNKGADPNRLGYGGISPLSHSLGDYFNITLFQLLLEKGANVNLANNCGATPLHVAAQTGKNDGMALLLSHGANVNAKQCIGGEYYTPLMNAVAANNIDGVKLLVQNGADMTAVDSSSETALMIATSKGYTDIADFLKQSGAVN